MCQPISWIKKAGHLLYLTNDDLQTRKGKKLLKKTGDLNDLAGHGAIREYFGLSENKGTNMEVNDLSSPKNFPDEIADAMRHGKFRNIFIYPDILTKSAQGKYEKVKKVARAKYGKVKQAAWDECEKVEQPAWAKYWKVKKAARAKYNKKVQAAWAEYKKVDQAAEAEYNKKVQAALTEYEKVLQATFWDLWADPKNRIKAWR